MNFKSTIGIVLVALMFVVSAAIGQDAFRIMPDGFGNPNTLIRVAPTYVNARVLAASVNESTTIPTGAKKVIFSSTCNFYAKPGGTAAVATDTTDGSASELNPSAWHLDGSFTTIGVISDTTCVVTLTYYK